MSTRSTHKSYSRIRRTPWSWGNGDLPSEVGVILAVARSISDERDVLLLADTLHLLRDVRLSFLDTQRILNKCHKQPGFHMLERYVVSGAVSGGASDRLHLRTQSDNA